MAKIKVRGYAELIQVPNDEATGVKKMLDRKESGDSSIALGRWTGKLKEIVFVLVDEEMREGNPAQKSFMDYYRHRDYLLTLSSSERAKISSWGSFSLFYYAVYHKKVDESLKEKVLITAAKFYDDNPQWTRVTMRAWMDMLEITPKSALLMKILPTPLNILERVESKEYNDVHEVEQFHRRDDKKALQLEGAESIVLDKNEIKDEDLPF